MGTPLPVPTSRYPSCADVRQFFIGTSAASEAVQGAVDLCGRIQQNAYVNIGFACVGIVVGSLVGLAILVCCLCTIRDAFQEKRRHASWQEANKRNCTPQIPDTKRTHETQTDPVCISV